MDEASLTPEMVARLRRLILGHVDGDPDRLAADRAEAATELDYIATTGLLAEIVRSWIDSDEFVETWSSNATFRRAQGFEALESASMHHRPLIHVHIPKTAGTSLNTALASHFPTGEVFAQRTVDQLLATPLGRLVSYRFLAGHWGFSAVELLAFRDPFTFTMSRDPHEHVPSLWRFLRREGRIREDIRLEEWIIKPDGPGSDPQTRSFVRRMSVVGLELAPFGDWRFPRTETDAQLAEELPMRFATLDLAAPSERVADLYRRIVRECELPDAPVAEFPRLNTTDPEPISDEARELIDAITPLDRRFHELCIERWETT